MTTTTNDVGAGSNITVGRRRSPLRALIQSPFWLVLLPVFVSAVVWFIPWGTGVRRGFQQSQPIDWNSAFIIAMWYLPIAVLGFLAWRVGRSVAPISSLDSADDDRAYRTLTWVGAVGVIGMYALVELHSPGLVFRALAIQQFNLVRAQVPQTPGIATLRYATILSGAIAFHRLIVLRQWQRVHVVNVVLLLANVLVASRLALLMSVLLFLGLVAVRPRLVAVRRKSSGRLRFVALAVLVFSILTFANYSRNANYYRAQYGITNPFTMLAGESVAYLGAPFQVSVGTVDAAEQSLHAPHESVASNATSLLTPTFFTPQPSTAYKADTQWYRDTVSVDSSLTTNSALATLYGLLGLWAFPLLLFVAVVGGFFMGHFSRYRSYVALAGFVIGYCFAELWRTYLFNEGIVWFLLLAVVFACRPRRRSGPASSRNTKMRAT